MAHYRIDLRLHCLLDRLNAGADTLYLILQLYPNVLHFLSHV